jgi:hypothetical protein
VTEPLVFPDSGELPIDYFDEAPTPPPAHTLERLTRLAFEARDLRVQITDETIALAQKQEKLNKIEREFIPDIMDSLAMSEFKLTDGSVVSVKNEVQCSISEERKPAAFEWLTNNQFDGIIKTKVLAEFGKNEIGAAKQALDVLIHAGYVARMDRNVHPMTLKSFVKEQLEKGTNIPIETFGIFEFRQAKIKLPTLSRRK